MGHFLTAVVVAVAGLAAAYATAAAQAPASVLDGVYTKEQAERGHAAYESYCHQCHEGLENDGPDLTNKAFLDRWREDTLQPLFTFIKTTMPGTAPGSLDDRVYADLIAFMLEEQELPAGTTELTPDMMGRVQLVGPDGPQPLANLTIVRTVGCLAAAPNDTWTLERATGARPVRGRIVGATTPEELKASASQALGTQTYPLMSVKPQSPPLAGHKVLVKGVLTRQKTLERINVMALDSVGTVCGG